MIAAFGLVDPPPCGGYGGAVGSVCRRIAIEMAQYCNSGIFLHVVSY